LALHERKKEKVEIIISIIATTKESDQLGKLCNPLLISLLATSTCEKEQ
jgi:hypothetical protein